MPERTDHRGPGILTRYHAWRARVVANPVFRATIQRLPLLRTVGRKKAEALFSITSGFVQSQVLSGCLETGVLKALRARPMTLADLSSATRLPKSRLEPLLRAADALSIIRLAGDGYYSLADIGAVVASDAGVEAMIWHHRDFYADLGDVGALLRQHVPDTRLNRFWSYAGEGRDPVTDRDAARYSTVMASSQSMIVEEIIAAHDFSGCRHILDVGGGQGVFVSAAARQWSGPDLTLFDLPPVAAQAELQVADAGLGSRIRCVGGSFLDDPLPTEQDCVTLIRVLFDHGDEIALRILEACRTALDQDGTLVIAEPMAGNSPGARMATAYFSLYLLSMGPGRCRSPEEIGDLAIRAGFSSYRIKRCRTPMLATLVVADV